MSDRAGVLTRRILLVLVTLSACVLWATVHGGVAQADPFGELKSFGETEILTPEKAIGYDPESGDLFVVDQDANSFKILDLSPSSGKSIASAVFTPKVVTGQQDFVQGVAIDPTMHRLYVLALVTRREEPDQEITAASALYAFSTEPSGNKIEPAEGTEKTGTDKAILANQNVLQPTSKEFGVSLIEPSGIAVDPTTHDILITATVDRGKLSKVEGEEEAYVREATVAVQRVHSNGELGARYIDSATEGEIVEESCLSLCIDSPVVSSAGHVYVATGEGDELEEFPVPASAKVLPETVTVTPVPEVKFNIGCEHECRLGGSLVPEFPEKLTEIPAELSGAASLTISPEGTIWSRARVKYQLEGLAKEFQYGGALEFTSGFEEQGWTGGQSLAASAGKCVIDDLTEVPAFAAGKEGKLFVLDRSPSGGEEPKAPRIIEFGPGGAGCPHPTGKLSASVGGLEVKEGEAVPIADAVTLAGALTQANALSVEWSFGDGTSHTSTVREGQATEIQHTFAKTGNLTVKEKIHTDNLAQPTVELQEKIDVVGAPKVTTEEATQIASTSATLTGTVNPNGAKVEACEFEYGETTSYSSGKVPCSPMPGAGEEPIAVSAKLTGLAKHTHYHFRLVAKNKSGEEKGADRTFSTETKPVATTEGASSVGESSATLSASVNPEGLATQCKFEYGTSPSYGAHVACATAPGSGESPVAVSASLTGLSPGATYHYRIVAEAEGGAVVSYGLDKTFKTEESRRKIEEEEARHRQEAEAQRHAEEEAAAAAAKKHQEEEAAAAAAKKHQEEEAAAAAAKKRQEEEAKAKKPLTRAQLLAKALKACKKEPKHKRAKCEATARKKYAPPKKKGKK